MNAAQPPVGNTWTPPQAWTNLRVGNERYVAGQPEHPGQDALRRSQVANLQTPHATIFGCADSRVAAEMIFDQGLGDLFVVRTAGHVVDSSVLGSLEFGEEVLGIPLLVVLGHDSCGAVKATAEAMKTGKLPGGFIRDLVERVTPGLLRPQLDQRLDVDDLVSLHVQETVRLLLDRSQILAKAVAEGRCAVVGLVYELVEGRVRVVAARGDVGDDTVQQQAKLVGGD